MRLTEIVALAAAFAVIAPAGAQDGVIMSENFDTGAPEEMWSGDLLLGPDGAWRGAVEDGRYVLANDRETGAARYIFISGVGGYGPEDLATASISVSVDAAAAGEPGGAGLLYRFDPEARTYAAMSVSNGGGYRVWIRDSDGLRQVMSGEGGEAGSAPYALTARADGDLIAFEIDGAQVASFSNSAVNGHGFGIFAIGVGEFAFDDFVAASTPTSPAAAGSDGD